MKTLISIDPGLSTGLCVGTYSDTEPFKLTHFFQIEGGVEEFIRRVHYDRPEEDEYFQVDPVEFETLAEFNSEVVSVLPTGKITFIAEKFMARSVSQGGFSYRTRDLEPLRVEGAMLAMGLNPTWVSPPQQYFSGGEGKAKKKQAQHRWLKEKGLYVTGKMVGCDNADDVRSAIAHAIAYLVRQKHRPTIEHYFPKENND